MRLDDYQTFPTLEAAFEQMKHLILVEGAACGRHYSISYQGTAPQPHLRIESRTGSYWELVLVTPSTTARGATQGQYKGRVYEPARLRLSEYAGEYAGNRIYVQSYPIFTGPEIAGRETPGETIPEEILPVVNALASWRGQIDMGWRSVLVHGFRWPGVDAELHRRLTDEHGLVGSASGLRTHWNGWSLRYRMYHEEDVYGDGDRQRLVLCHFWVFPARFLHPVLVYETDIHHQLSLEMAEKAIARMRKARDQYELLLRSFWSD